MNSIGLVWVMSKPAERNKQVKSCTTNLFVIYLNNVILSEEKEVIKCYLFINE